MNVSWILATWPGGGVTVESRQIAVHTKTGLTAAVSGGLSMVKY